MSNDKFSSTEEKASYGIGLQMGQQISGAFEGVSPEAVIAGIEDVLAAKPPQLSPDDINAAFQLIQERMKQE